MGKEDFWRQKMEPFLPPSPSFPLPSRFKRHVRKEGGREEEGEREGESKKVNLPMQERIENAGFA